MEFMRSHTSINPLSTTGLRLCRLMLAGLLLLNVVPGDATAQNAIEFEVPIIINQALSGNIDATIISNTRAGETETTVEVSPERLKQLFSKFANDEQLENWFGDRSSAVVSRGSNSEVVIGAYKSPETTNSAKASSSGETNRKQSGESSTERNNVSLYTLRQRGLEINFNSGELSIYTVIPRLGTQTISVRGQRQPVPEENYAQARFASGLNFRARNTYNHREVNGGERGFGDTIVDVDGFTSFGGFGGWGLLYGANYDEGNEKPFARQDVTLIHDNYKTGVRYSIGDFTALPSGLQSSPSLLGINIARRYSEINPFRNIQPAGRSSFTLDRAARVSFEVNGLIVDTRELQAGKYSVGDFPLTFGGNNVRVYVDDGSGNVEIANFSAFTDLDLLAPGISTFSLSLGVQRDAGANRSRRYEDDPVALAFYERGMTQNLTLGAQAEVAENQALVGSTAIYGTRYGLFGIEAAVSKREGFDNGYSTVLSYSHETEVRSGLRFNANLQYDFQSEDFGGVTALGPTFERSGVRGALSMSYSGYAFSINGTSAESNDITTKSINARMSKSFGRYNMSMDYRRAVTDGQEPSDNVTFAISGRFGSSSYQGQYQSATEEYRLGWSGESLLDAGDGAINQVLLSSDDSLDSAQINGGYIGSRFVFSADHLETQSRDNLTGGADTSATTLRASTAIGFADGRFAFGRPFNDGFLIAAPHKNIRGKKLDVTRGGVEGSRVTGTKHLSTTLVPLSGSYRAQRLSFAIDDLPLGYDIGAGEVDVFPSFLAGYTYQIGSDAANTVIGKVLWPDNTAPSLIVGKMIPLDGGDEITVFTNKTGRFVGERARFGKYAVVFNNGEADFKAEVTLAESDEPGLVQLGTITLEKVQ